MSFWAAAQSALLIAALPAGWTFDRTITLEGAGTATAALLAALAYITDLIGRRVRDANARRRNTRARMILDILQRNFYDGADEAEIYRNFFSMDEDCIELRNKYGLRQKRRTIRREHDLERQLVGMVYERLIELSGPDHYKINYFGNPEEDRRRRQQAELEAREHEMRDGLLAELRSELAETLWLKVRQGGLPSYNVADHVRSLIRLGEITNAAQLRALITSANSDDRSEVAIGLAEVLAHR